MFKILLQSMDNPTGKTFYILMREPPESNTITLQGKQYRILGVSTETDAQNNQQANPQVPQQPTESPDNYEPESVPKQLQTPEQPTTEPQQPDFWNRVDSFTIQQPNLGEAFTPRPINTGQNHCLPQIRGCPQPTMQPRPQTQVQQARPAQAMPQRNPNQKVGRAKLTRQQFLQLMAQGKQRARELRSRGVNPRTTRQKTRYYESPEAEPQRLSNNRSDYIREKLSQMDSFFKMMTEKMNKFKF